MNFPIRVGISPTLNIRGVLATEDIKAGTVVEVCPIILTPISEDTSIEQTLLGKFYFEWNEKYSCFVLGFGALYNHSDSPNLGCEYLYEKNEVIFRALSDIKMGEELTHNYMDGTDRKLDKDYLDFNKDIIT